MATGSMRDFHSQLAIRKAMAVRREEYLDHMTFRANVRPLFTEIFGPIVGLKEEWAAQGATAAELDCSAFRYRDGQFGPVPVQTGWVGGEEERILEETDEHVIGRDRMGRTVKLVKSAASLPHPLDFPVAGAEDWRRVREHYEFGEDRLAGDWAARAREHRQAGRVVTVSVPGGFDEPRRLMGEEALCLAYYEQPDLIHDILQTIGETAFRVLDRVSAAAPVDALIVGEDLAGKSGPMAGPKQVREFIAPYYRRVWDLLRARGARLFIQDSDGNVGPVIEEFLQAGVNMMYPMEPAAGMDIVKVRQRYGTRLAIMGGIDKHVLRRSRRDIVAELEYKIPPMVRTGGCVLGLDHRIPNGTPLANYRFYIEKAWEIMDGEAARACRPAPRSHPRGGPPRPPRAGRGRRGPGARPAPGDNRLDRRPPMTEQTPSTSPPPAPPGGYPPPWGPPPRRRSLIGRLALGSLVLLFVLSVLLNIELSILLLGRMDRTMTAATLEKGQKDQVVAVYVVAGLIDGDQTARFGQFYRTVRDDDNIKAVVLRIDSGGGGVSASDQICQMVMDIRVKLRRPVVVSMGGVAASGGYYIAAPADAIYAEPTTITGSIGVIAAWPVLKKMMDNWGVEFVTIRSTHAEDWKAKENFWESPDEQTRKNFKDLLDHMQGRFEQVVRAGRGNKVDVESFPAELRDKLQKGEPFNGKEYTAAEAQAVGLVDQIGYLSEATAAAAGLARLSQPKIVQYTRSPGLLEALLLKSGPGIDQIGTKLLGEWGSPQILMLWRP